MTNTYKDIFSCVFIPRNCERNKAALKCLLWKPFFLEGVKNSIKKRTSQFEDGGIGPTMQTIHHFEDGGIGPTMQAL